MIAALARTALLLFLTITAANASVLCARRSTGTVRVRDVCRSSETQLDPTTIENLPDCACTIPTIRIVAATYAENCGAATDVRSLFVTRCEGLALCATNFQWPDDPAPNCAKDLTLSFACGSDPTEHQMYAPGEANGRLFSFTCYPVATFIPPPPLGPGE